MDTETDFCATYRAWRAAKCAALTTVISSWNAARCVGRLVQGARTFLFFGVTGIMALSATLQGFDIASFISRWTNIAVSSEDVMVFMAVGGLVLRFITTTPAFTRWQKAAQGGNDGVSAGVGSGSVDEPEEKKE